MHSGGRALDRAYKGRFILYVPTSIPHATRAPRSCTRVRVEVGGTALGSARRDHITALGLKTYLLMLIVFLCNAIMHLGFKIWRKLTVSAIYCFLRHAATSGNAQWLSESSVYRPPSLPTNS